MTLSSKYLLNMVIIVNEFSLYVVEFHYNVQNSIVVWPGVDRHSALLYHDICYKCVCYKWS